MSERQHVCILTSKQGGVLASASTQQMTGSQTNRLKTGSLPPCCDRHSSTRILPFKRKQDDVLCVASRWTYRFSQHLCFSGEVECNVLGGGEGGNHYTCFIRNNWKISSCRGTDSYRIIQCRYFSKMNINDLLPVPPPWASGFKSRAASWTGEEKKLHL